MNNNNYFQQLSCFEREGVNFDCIKERQTGNKEMKSNGFGIQQTLQSAIEPEPCFLTNQLAGHHHAPAPWLTLLVKNKKLQ